MGSYCLLPPDLVEVRLILEAAQSQSLPTDIHRVKYLDHRNQNLQDSVSVVNFISTNFPLVSSQVIQEFRRVRI